MSRRTAEIVLVTSIIAGSNATAWNIAVLVTGLSATFGTGTMIITTAGALLAGAFVGLVITIKPADQKHKKD